MDGEQVGDGGSGDGTDGDDECAVLGDEAGEVGDSLRLGVRGEGELLEVDLPAVCGFLERGPGLLDGDGLVTAVVG